MTAGPPEGGSASHCPSPVAGGQVPGRALLRPEPAAAALLIAVNDFFIKPHWPGLVAGKLSDIGICFLLPVVVAAALEWVRWAFCVARRHPFIAGGLWTRAAACLVTTAYFGAMQLSPWFAELHESLIHAIIPFRPRPDVLADRTDLVALAMVPLAWLHLRRLGSRSEQSQACSRSEPPAPSGS